MIHRRLPDLRGDHLIGGLNGLRYPVKHLLDRPQADREAQHRIAKSLNDGTAIRLCPGHLGDESGQARSKSGPMLPWNQPFVRLPATRTDPLVENKVRHVHLDFRKLDLLMGIVGSKINHLFVAAGACLGLDQFGLCGGKQTLAVSFVTLFRPWFLMLFSRLFTLVGTV